jgi:hypothetical protein
VDGLKAAGLAGVNTAVSWWEPGASREVDPAAVPLVLTGTVGPMLVAPSLNCTLPTAVGGVIVAVRVTRLFWAAVDTGDTVSVVMVTVGARTWVGCGAVPGGAEWATPPISSPAAITATGTMQTPTACQEENLLSDTRDVTSIPVTREAKDPVTQSRQPGLKSPELESPGPWPFGV